MKRLIGIVLGLMLMFGVTITAEAETAPVAKVGDTEYTSYSNALTAWNNGANDGENWQMPDKKPISKKRRKMENPRA